MKKVFKLFYVSALLVAILTVFMPFNKKTDTLVDAAVLATLPANTVKDSSPDVVSLHDMTIDGYSNQTSLNIHANADLTYNKTNNNGSLVFKFKYDVQDLTAADNNSIRIHLDVSDDKWNTNNALWIRGNGTFLYSYVEPNYNPIKSSALTKGMHNVEFGRIAILNEGDSSTTGNYYVYYKVDGTEIYSAINPYDNSKIGNTIFINVGNANSYNYIYDADYSYETPQYVSVSDLKYDGSLVGNSIKNEGKNYTYDVTATNKSVVFVSNVDYKVAEGSQICIYGDSDKSWDYAGYIWFQPDKVVFGINKEDGTFNNNKDDIKYTALTGGSQHTIEYGRLAIMNGSTFTGKYHVYFKLDGKIIFAIDQAIYEGVSKGGRIRFSGNGNFNYVDAYSQEEAKEISVSNLKKSGALVGDKYTFAGQADLTYDNTDHKDNYSLVFKFKYVVDGTGSNQFHLSSSTGKYKNSKNEDVDNKWSSSSSFILNNGGKVHVGKSTLTSVNVGNYDIVYAMTVGETYNVEFGRIANMAGNNFAGTYHVYLKINDTIVKEANMSIAQIIVQDNLLFVTGSNNVMLDINYVAESYEDADIVSISDLKLDGASVGQQVVINADKKFTYSATKAHKSIIFKFKYLVDDPSTAKHQIHFADGYIPDADGGVVWFRNDNLFIRKDCSGGYVTVENPFTVAKEYNVEIGKLYILTGSNAGHYYIYVKVGNDIVADYVVASMPDKPCIYITGSSNDTFKDFYGPDTYESADEISVEELKLKGSLVGDVITMTGDTAYSYTATASHKSVIFKFKYEAAGSGTQDGCQFHFSDNYIGEGMVWVRNDKEYIQRASGYASGGSAKTAGTVYNVEIGKLYITGGRNAGKYYIYVKINDVLSTDYIASTMPDKANIFTTSALGNHIYDIDYVAPTYEEADDISVMDLSVSGLPIGDVITLSSATGYSYAANAAHKSVIFKFKYEVTCLNVTDKDDLSCQFHFSDTYSSEGYVWLRDDKNRIGITGGYIVVDPLTELKTYDIEIGKLYVTGGKNTGKYYIYLKVDGKLAVDYFASTMPDKANIFMTGSNGNHIYDINYVAPAYEDADVISVSNLRRSGALVGNEIYNMNYAYTYDSTKEHKSVIFKFLFNATNIKKDIDLDFGTQVFFSNTWAEEGGMMWLRYDKFFIQRDKADPEDKASYLSTSDKVFTENKLYNVEVGKIYVTAGTPGGNVGKYLIYVNVDGNRIISYYTSKITDNNSIFITGTNGDSLIDINSMHVDLDYDLYKYDWDESKSGILFTASFDKQFKDLLNLTEVGFVLTPVNDPSHPVKLQGKLIDNGSTYLVKAAIASMNSNNITQDYKAVLYYKFGDKEVLSRSITTSLYDELSKEDSLSSKLSEIKGKVLEFVIDDETMAPTGATKAESELVYTGSEESYASFILNGNILSNNCEIMIGATNYKVTLGANSVSLEALDKEMVWGASEHFVEINTGHDPLMTADNLAPMTTELGLTSVRLEVNLDDIFDINGDELIINYGYVAAEKAVIKKMQEEGGITDFLGVLWAIYPSDYLTAEWAADLNKGDSRTLPWVSKTAPSPTEQADLYLRWLKLNEKAVKIAAELFPEIKSFEAWNEPELYDGIDGVLGKPGYIGSTKQDPASSFYTVEEKARILTDIMYYYNKGLKAANPELVLTSPSLCCYNGTGESSNHRFKVSSPEFLKAIYAAIKDNTPVTGYESIDTEADNYFQVINLHPYVSPDYNLTESNWIEFINKFITIANNNDDGNTQVWITEFGVNQKNLEGQALTDAVNLLISIMDKASSINNMTKFYFYKVHDYLMNEGNTDEWGLYIYDTCEIKPSGIAVKNKLNPEE